MYNIDNIELGKKLKRLREAKKLKENEVAEYIDVHPSSYCNYEKGRRRPKYPKLKLLAQLFEVTTDYLLSNEVEV